MQHAIYRVNICFCLNSYNSFSMSVLQESEDIEVPLVGSQLVKEMKFYPPDLIAENVYLGGVESTLNLKWLQYHNIQAIVQLEDLGAARWSDMIYLNIEIADDPNEDILQYLDKTTEFIHHHRNAGHGVLIHCFMGVSRSATVAIAWFGHLFDFDFSYEWVFDEIKSCRSCINPNEGFIRQLQEYFEKNQKIRSEKLTTIYD